MDVARNMFGSIGEGRVVHHRDGDKSNFRRSNLTVMDRSNHSSYHARGVVYSDKAKGKT